MITEMSNSVVNFLNLKSNVLKCKMSVDERGITAQKIKTSPAMQHKCQGGSTKGEQSTMKDPSAGSEHRDIETMERGEATVKNLQGRIF